MIHFVPVQGLVLMNSTQQDMLSRPGFVAVQHLVDLNCKILPLPQQITIGPQMAQWSSTDCMYVYYIYIYVSINLVSSCCCMLGGTWRVSSSSGGAGDLKSADIWSSVAPFVVWRWCFCQCYTWDAGLKCQGRLLSKHIPLLALRGWVGGEGRRGCQLE